APRRAQGGTGVLRGVPGACERARTEPGRARRRVRRAARAHADAQGEEGRRGRVPRIGRGARQQGCGGEAGAQAAEIIEPNRIHVLAGVNGAGKSSIGGAAVRSYGGEYYNPDEAAKRLMAARPGIAQPEANAAAWHQGRRLLGRAIAERLGFALGTTPGGTTF